MRIDFAHAVGHRLLVYGWIAGFSNLVASAVILIDDSTIDLLAEAVKVRRADVTHNFRDRGLAGDEHGFLALVEVPELRSGFQTLRLVVRLQNGVGGESEWPIIRDEAIAAATLRAHEGALRPLIPQLSPSQKRILAGFGSPSPFALRSDDLKDSSRESVIALPLHIQLCAVLPGGVLVLGGVLPRPFSELHSLVLQWDSLQIDLLHGLIRVDELCSRAEEAPVAGAASPVPSDFLYAAALPGGMAPTGRELRIHLACNQGTATTRVTPRLDSHDAQAQFAAHLATVDPNARLELCERLAASLQSLNAGADLTDLVTRQIAQAILDLPTLLDAQGPPFRAQMHVDRTIRIADVGIFLIGWFQSDPRVPVQVVCHAEEGDHSVSANWIRWARPDVEAHQANRGFVVTEDPGFFCFVPSKVTKRPHYLSVSAGHGGGYGRAWRVRVPAPPAESAPEAIRGVLTSVDPNRGDLRRLLDQHVGPAVGTLWGAHPVAGQRSAVTQFGPERSEPPVSVIVPLFGRFDFADYQLALFADDPDFETAELIYVVDDPSIYQDLRRQCHDLYALYGVPFTLAYPGRNLGFAGATNFGAGLAHAPYLLLLNSDVMPQAPGWLGSLLSIYQSYPDAGVLGAKLLFEDGTVQHAGMVSRRHAQWQDLWINYHPHKGMSPRGLAGVLEVECVSAACALVEAGLFHALGGLSEDYIIGDFEDSDFCHRVHTHGRRNRVALDVSLYHLERQSQALAGDANWRTAVTIYNCWLHNRRWGASIEGAHA
jgi:GT2 family glycosyltransferase